MGRYCVVCNSHNKSFSLFRFPKDRQIRQQWLVFCRLDEEDLTTATCLCSQHFDAENFVRLSNRLTPKAGALPTISGPKHVFQSPTNKRDIGGTVTTTSTGIGILTTDNASEIFDVLNNFVDQLRRPRMPHYLTEAQQWKIKENLKEYRNPSADAHGNEQNSRSMQVVYHYNTGPWLRSLAEEINKRYRKLRRDTIANTDSWSHSQYCERLAYHFYNLACYFYDELYYEHKVDLESVKTYLEKCSAWLAGVSPEDGSRDTNDLKNDATKFLAEVNEIFQQQSRLLIQYSSSNIRKYAKLCIVLGNVDDVPLQQWSEEDRRHVEQQIGNVLLLRHICTLEEALAVPEYKSTFVIAEMSSHLSLAYQLAGQSCLSMRYKGTAERLIDSFLESETKECDNAKEIIDEFIRKEITEHKSCLDKVKDYIEEKFHKSLSSIDKDYIESKYIEYCSKFWLTEITATLKKLADDKSRDIIQEVFSSLDYVECLNDIPDIFGQAAFCKLLIQHRKFVSETEEKTLMCRFKKECLERIVAYSDSAKSELKFLKTFVDLLRESENISSIAAELELEDFCDGKLSFGVLLKKILGLDVGVYGESLTELQEEAKCWRQEEDLFLIDKLKQVICAYIKPIKIQELQLDGQLAIEVVGKTIVVREILGRLESMLSKNSNIEQVRFVGADIMHIDEDFKNELWHGKNVVVLTNTMKIHRNVCWDVSGKENNYTYASDAGTGEDGGGKNGKDGYAGESGGNVLILAKKIENPANFTVISNGGKGSKGQDGGKGKDGKDGKGITKPEFEKKFPPIARLVNVSVPELINRTIASIQNDFIIEEEWYSCRETPSDGHIFIDAKRHQGDEITFSYCVNGFNRQGFLLYKGSLGKQGGSGGEHGLGGSGGYAGEILVRDPESRREFGIIKRTEQGENGDKGQGGLHGSAGKNGWDMAYCDYQWWSEAKFYGTDKKSKLNLKYDAKSEERVWCPYKEQYVEIGSPNIEHKKGKKYDQRKNTRQNNDRQYQAQATRKKDIAQSSILASYSHHCSSVEESILQHLQAELDTSRNDALQAIHENQKQQEKQSTALKVSRNVNFIRHSKIKSQSATTAETYTSTYGGSIRPKANRLIQTLKKSPRSLCNWFQLKDVELSLSELNQLFSCFEALKGDCTTAKSSRNPTENQELQDIENLLIIKYKLATLHEIAVHLQPYQEVSGTLQSTPKNTARYLTERKEEGSSKFHPILGPLNQYLYENGEEQRERISKFIKENLLSCDGTREILKHSLLMFILEAGNLTEAHPCVKKCYDEYKHFLDKKYHDLNIFFEAFKSELAQPSHVEVSNLWIESIKQKAPNSELEEELEKYPELKDLYSRFNAQLKLEYDWNQCYEDQAILKEYNDCIEKGPLSACYRELLAQVFEITIKLYVEEQYGGLCIQDIHNSSSKAIVHVLHRDSEFIQLSVDENFVKLEGERQKKNALHAKVLKELESFKHKQEFDGYLEAKRFLSSEEGEEFDQSLCNSCSSSEEQAISKITAYFSTEKEKQLLRERLEKIRPQNIGQQDILHYMSERLCSEGKNVSSDELYCFVNSILSSLIEDKRELHIFCWIVAAYPQRNWTHELILLQLENYFKRALPEKSKWRACLYKIADRRALILLSVKLTQYRTANSVSAKCVDYILHLLSNIPDHTVNLERLELSEWPYALKEKYWLHRLLKLANWQGSENLPTTFYYLLAMENSYGTDLVEELLAVLEKKPRLSDNDFSIIFSNFHNEKWNFSKKKLQILDSCTKSEWRQEIQYNDVKDKDVAQLVEVIEGNQNTSARISLNLTKIEESIRICKAGYAIDGRPIADFTEDDIKKWSLARFHGKQEFAMEMLAVIDRAIELKRGFKLRDTQILAVLALLTNDHSTLAQVATGEGKTLIVVAISLIKALCGEKVDVITSSSVLAKRDADGNRDICNLFGIDVSHNCSEDIEKRKVVYSSNQIVYGDLSSFQRDYLLDRFYMKNILGDRDFANAIVDEVDSMLLDKGNNMLYLSHELAGLDKLESVYIYIWQWINRPARDYEDIFYAFDIQAIKEAVISDLYGLVRKDDIGLLGPDLSEQHRILIWEGLVKAEILDGRGKLLKENIEHNALNEILSTEFYGYKDRLSYLLKECIERDRFIHVPNHLRSFVETHLESWIKSALVAFSMKEGENYVVDVDREGISADRSPNITILDRDTGTDQASSQWDEALHQFLQLKHGCKLSLQSLKAVFISNVSFFRFYKNLYGLTGTLGSQRERDLLREIHKVDFVTIPTARRKQFHEDKPILCSGKEEWINHILSVVQMQTSEKNRSVLIICESVNDVEVLRKAFVGKAVKHVHTYIRDYEEFAIAQSEKELDQGQIIIATNLAGRGTDIKITEGLRKAGGLHVCLTYLPNNIRIEQQAFGRAGRCGEKGSGQLIIMYSEGQAYSNSKILDLKNVRNKEELSRISDIKAYYDNQITVEENWFKAFAEQYQNLKHYLSGACVPAEVEEILLQSCLDKWAFWLDANSKRIQNVTGEQCKSGFNELSIFLSHFKNLGANWLAWVERNPVQMVKLGKYYSQHEQLSKAIELFDEVIKQEPYFSEAAHYYKAFAVAKRIDWEQKPLNEEDSEIFKNELRATAWLLDEHYKFALSSGAFIGKIRKNNNASIIQIDAYEEQQESLANLYQMFSQSIEDIFGHFVTARSLVNVDINEELAEVLYEDLLRVGILKSPSVKRNITEEELRTISYGHGFRVEVLKNVLSKYEGKEIDEQEMQKALKEEVPLPSRGVFWKSLVAQDILSKEVKYVTIDREKLREIEPSLLDSLDDEHKFVRQTLESNYEEMFLNAEQVAQQKQNHAKEKYITFEKQHFLEAVGKEKYLALKRRGVLSFNRKARLEQSKIESATFPSYDSITVEDFVKVNITRNDAEMIVAELVKQKIIQKKGSADYSVYGLNPNSDTKEGIKLPNCPVYESAVKTLVSTCFAYRIALREIACKLAEKNVFVALKLLTKPHQSLVMELIEQRVISPATVTTDNFEKKLRTMYSLPMARHDFEVMLSRNKLAAEGHTQELFEHLLSKGWISQKFSQIASNVIKIIPEEFIDSTQKGNMEKDIKNVLPKLYCISDSAKRQISLSSPYKGIEKTLNKVLNNRLQLGNEDTIKSIIRVLERSRSPLEALKVPDIKQKPLTELCSQGNFGNIEEVHVFFLNGLDQLLQFEEKKWTREMRLYTAGVAAMGIAQIVIGTAIELWSAGVFYHVGAAFVNEGVSDLFFATAALRSGYFSWKDYRQHKRQSLMITAGAFCVGAYLTRIKYNCKLSRFGHKLAGPEFEFGEKVATMSGKKLISAAGWKVVGKEVGQRIAMKAIEGLAIGMANSGVDIVIENHIKGLCENITSTILSDIERKVAKHNITASLQRIFCTLGKEKARELINYVTQNCFTKQSYIEEFLPIATAIASSVIEDIKQATEKMKKAGTKGLALPLSTIGTVIKWSERSAHIIDIVRITDKFLDDLDQKLNTKLNDDNWKENAERTKTQAIEEDYESFEKEVIDQWKSLLCEKAAQIMAQHIVGPVLKDGASQLLRCIGKKIQQGYQSLKESKYREYFEQRKEQYCKDIQTSEEQQHTNASQTERDITKKYHDDLRKLMVKTRNPRLFADIVRENIPMDLTCVRACTLVLNTILKGLGISIAGLNIIVEGEGGVRQKFSTKSEGGESKTISLKLKDNHFEFCGGSTSGSEGSSQPGNNCLYEAACDAFPELRDIITPQIFRAKTADYVQHDRGIQYHIQQGWHGLPISLGAIGGARKNPGTLNEKAEAQSPYQHGNWKFNESKDKDLRKDRPLSNEELHEQRAEAFDEALIKINEHLNSIGKKQGTPFAPAGQFTATKHDTVLVIGDFGRICIGLYPVEMEAIVEIQVERETFKYKCRIDLDNPTKNVIEAGLQGPHGPHIGYQVISPKSAPRSAKGVTGHILINKDERLPDRGRSEYSIDNSNIPKNVGIPPTRVFFPPNRPNSSLQRIDDTEIELYNDRLVIDRSKKKVRGEEEVRGQYIRPDY